MQVWLLLIYIAGAHQGGAATIEFSTEELCRAAEVEIVAWFEGYASVEDVGSTCIRVEK